MYRVLLMHKLTNISDVNILTENDIDFLTRKTNIQCDSIKQKNNTLCPNCRTNDHVLHDNFGGIIVCSECGCVLETCMLDHHPEWKNKDDGNSSRCGLPTNALLPQSSLGTTIGGNCNYKLKTLHNWGIMPAKERSLNLVLNNIREKCDKAGLIGCIADDAKILYKIASECNGTKKSLIIRNKNRVGLISACVFYACKRQGQSKSPKEIAKIFNISTSCVNKGCKKFAEYVKYKNIDYNTNLCYPS